MKSFFFLHKLLSNIFFNSYSLIPAKVLITWSLCYTSQQANAKLVHVHKYVNDRWKNEINTLKSLNQVLCAIIIQPKSVDSNIGSNFLSISRVFIMAEKTIFFMKLRESCLSTLMLRVTSIQKVSDLEMADVWAIHRVKYTWGRQNARRKNYRNSVRQSHKENLEWREKVYCNWHWKKNKKQNR